MHIYDPISNIFIQLGPFVWYKYSLMIMIGIVIATILGLKEGKRLGIKSQLIMDGILIILPLSILGARLWYVIFEWNRYNFDILKIISIQDGGLAIHGGIFVAFIATYVYTRIKKIDVFKVFDIMAPGFILAQAFGRWGNFFNQEAHGGVIGGVVNNSPTLNLDQQRYFLTNTIKLPDYIADNMFLYGPNGLNYYHPTFLYESLWNILGFIVIIIIRRTKLVRSGDLLAIYLIWYSIGRFFIESMRTDSLYIGNTGLRTAQFVSIILVAISPIYMIIIRKMFKRPKYKKSMQFDTDM
jgi:phosphatidylglycerol:prolipoprotein diacylglycerol transferase